MYNKVIEFKKMSTKKVSIRYIQLLVISNLVFRISKGRDTELEDLVGFPITNKYEVQLKNSRHFLLQYFLVELLSKIWKEFKLTSPIVKGKD